MSSLLFKNLQILHEVRKEDDVYYQGAFLDCRQLDERYFRQ